MTHIQKAVEAIGNKGRYQKILFAFLIIVYMELGLMLIGSTFVFMNPQFECPGIKDPSQDDACPIIDQCTFVNEYTATYYAGLYCDGQTARNFIQSAPYIGSILGLLFLTPYADEKGKKKMFCISQGLCILGLLINTIGIYTSTSVVIILGQIILGSGSYCILIIGYVIVGQLCDDKFKQIVIITLNAMWAFGEIIIGALYFWFNYWSNFVIIILLIPNVGLFLFGLFFLVQSPYYLIEKEENIQKAVKSLSQIATFNKTDLKSFVDIENELRAGIATIEEQNHKNKDQPKVSRFAIFKDLKYLKILLLVAVVEIGVNAYYYGIQFSLGKIGTNFGYNILLTGTIQFVAFFSSNFFITKLPRKFGQIGLNIICILLGLLFFFNFSEVPQTVLLGVGRFFNAIAMGLIPFLQSQPFPHYYRSSVWGYIEGLSQIGNFITPYIVTACQNSNINSLIVFSFMLSVLGIVPMLFIKETLNRSEDELLEEDEKENRLEAGISINSQEIQSTEKSLIS